MAENDGLIEALTRENELFERLTAERREADEARDALRSSARVAADEQIESLVGRQREVIATANEQAQILEAIQNDAAALAEVTAQPLWRELLPLTRLVNPTRTPAHLQARMQANKTRLDAALAKDAVDEAKFQTGQRLRAARLKQQELDVGGEQADVDRIRRTLDDIKVSRDRRRELVDLEIGRVDPQELQRLEASGLITSEERTRELQSRESRSLQLTQQRLVIDAQQIELMSDEELANRTDQMAINERRRREDVERERDASKMAALQTKISNADDTQLLDMLTSRQITTRQYELEIQTRESQELTIEGQQQSVTRGARAGKLETLASLPDEQMDDYVQTHSEVTAEDARQIRMERLGARLTINAQQLESVQREYEFADQEQRESMVANGVVSKTFAKKVSQAERNKDIAAAQYELAFEQQQMAAQENARSLYVDSLLIGELDELINEANKRGGQVALQSGMVLDLNTLVDRRNELTSASVDAQFDTMSLSLTDGSMRSSAAQIARTAGLPVDSDLDADGLFTLITDNADLDPTTMNALRNAKALYDASRRPDASQRESAMFAERAEEIMTQAEKLIVDSKINVMPKSQQPAATEYYTSRNGTVSNQVNAMNAFVEHAAYSAQSGAGSQLHDAGVTALKGVLASSDTAATTATITDPGERVSTVLRQNQNFDAVATAMFSQAIAQLYTTTATVLQDEQLQAMLNNSGSRIYNVSGQLDEQLLYEFLAERPPASSGGPPPLETYIKNWRQNGLKHFQAVNRPSGPSAVVQASMNKIFFENNGPQFMMAELERRMQAGVAATRNVKPPTVTSIDQEIAIGEGLGP